MIGQYKLVPLVQTPSINPGEPIKLEYYVTGRHPDHKPPEYVRMNINLGGLTIDHGTVTAYVGQKWSSDGKTLRFSKGQEIDSWTLPSNRKAFSLNIPEALFFPIQDNSSGDDPYRSLPLHGELQTTQEGIPPFKIELMIPKRHKPGDYEITSTLIYEQDRYAATDTSTSHIHINTWYERNELTVNAIIILVGLLGILFPIVRYFFL